MCEVLQLTRRYPHYVKVVSVEDGDQGWPGNNLIDLIDWLQAQLHEIPYGFQESAKCEFTVTEHHSGLSYVGIAISYTRPETDEEMQTRALREKELENEKVQKELELLEKLEAKYRNKT